MKLKDLWPMLARGTSLMLAEKAEGTHVRILGGWSKAEDDEPKPCKLPDMDREVRKIGNDNLFATNAIFIVLDPEGSGDND